MSEKRLVPVVELPSYNDAAIDDAISWDFDLPPGLDDPERIVVDTVNLQRIHRVASIRASHIQQYHGDKSEVTPSISGASSDGTATAGLTAHVSQAETQKTSKLDDAPHDPRLMQDYLKTRAIHRLNKSEISSQVVDLRASRDISREQAWANVVNQVMAKSLREASYDHLMGRCHVALKGIYAGIHAINIGTASISDEGYPYTAYLTVAGLSVGMEAWRNKHLYGESLIRERRWSAVAYVGYMQPEKYLATDALTRVLPVVKYRE